MLKRTMGGGILGCLLAAIIVYNDPSLEGRTIFAILGGSGAIIGLILTEGFRQMLKRAIGGGILGCVVAGIVVYNNPGGDGLLTFAVLGCGSFVFFLFFGKGIWEWLWTAPKNEEESRSSSPEQMECFGCGRMTTRGKAVECVNCGKNFCIGGCGRVGFLHLTKDKCPNCGRVASDYGIL